MRVAIVHDWLNQIGGAEGVLEVLHELYPQAPIYTSMYAPQIMPPHYRTWDIRTSFMQRLPGVTTHHQAFLPFYPLAFEQFDLSAYDLVISNASAFCKGVITRPGTVHLCYCLTPTRFLWAYPDYVAREGLGRLPRLFLPPFVSYLRLWDRLAADRVDAFAAISRAAQQRIKRYYGHDSTIIYPPVDTTAYTTRSDDPSHSVTYTTRSNDFSRSVTKPDQATQDATTTGARSNDFSRSGDYFLWVGRLIPYKRVDLAVRAFNELGLPLVVIGDGRDRANLERLAKPNVRFLGRLDNVEMRRYMAGCRAFIFPAEEDFGITPLEAQAAGRPVIAYAAGGALDTVIEGVTGEFFRQPTAESLAEAVRHFDASRYDPDACVANARRFDTDSFKENWLAFVAQHI